MKMFRDVPAVCLVAVLAGCVGGFRNDAAFQQHVADLRLTDMAYDAATKRLIDDGFRCDPNSDPKLHPVPSTFCHKSWNGTKGYLIWLQPSRDDANKTVVETSTSLVVA